MALWWVPHSHQPTFEEAMERLEHLPQHGARAFAFTFAERFDEPQLEDVVVADA